MAVVTQLLQEGVARQKEKVQSLSDMANQFTRQNHFMASELNDRARLIAERYFCLFFRAFGKFFLVLALEIKYKVSH